LADLAAHPVRRVARAALVNPPQYSEHVGR
jgi:hypothetical protein